MTTIGSTLRRVTCIVFMLALTTPVLAVPDEVERGRSREIASRVSPPEVRRGEPVLRKVIVLRPSAASESEMNFFATEMSDGSRAVTMRLPQRSVGSPALYGKPFRWSVDLEAGTYTTTWDALNERDLQFVDRIRKRYGLESETRPRVQTNSEPTVGWVYSHAAETWEPGAYVGFAGLTRTEAELAWSECSNGTMFNDGFYPSCWSNASTFAATTWFTNSCLPRHPASSSEWSLDGSVTGYYSNYDFWDDDKWTYSTERVSLSAYSGGWADGYVSHILSGEWASLLSGRDFPGPLLTRPSSCPYRYPTSGGGGSGGGGTGDDGSGDGGTGDGGTGGSDPWTCVDVEDGTTGDYLGTCCGYTTEAILDCAAGYAAE